MTYSTADHLDECAGGLFGTAGCKGSCLMASPAPGPYAGPEPIDGSVKSHDMFDPAHLADVQQDQHTQNAIRQMISTGTGNASTALLPQGPASLLPQERLLLCVVQQTHRGFRKLSHPVTPAPTAPALPVHVQADTSTRCRKGAEPPQCKMWMHAPAFCFTVSCACREASCSCFHSFSRNAVLFRAPKLCTHG